MKIKDKIDKRLNDTFTDNLCEFLANEFPKVAFKSEFNFLSMRRVTSWDTQDPKICAEIKKTVKAYEAAYSKAREEARKA